MIEITIRFEKPEDLPRQIVEAATEAISVIRAGKALDDLGREADAQAAAAQRPSSPAPSAAEAIPAPADGEEGRTVAPLVPDISRPKEPPIPEEPHADIVRLLAADLDTAEVTKVLIRPLLGKFPEIKGDPAYVLNSTATKFGKGVYARRKLEFAAKHLLKGNHEYFPDTQEIYGAIGRYEGHKARKAQEQPADMLGNGANGARA